jgi:hypothetical protein
MLARYARPRKNPDEERLPLLVVAALFEPAAPAACRR